MSPFFMLLLRDAEKPCSIRSSRHTDSTRFFFPSYPENGRIANLCRGSKGKTLEKIGHPAQHNVGEHLNSNTISLSLSLVSNLLCNIFSFASQYYQACSDCQSTAKAVALILMEIHRICLMWNGENIHLKSILGQIEEMVPLPVL